MRGFQFPLRVMFLLLLSTAVNAVPLWQDDPLPTDFDWILLTSGEWLKGDIEALYEGELEFDSDNLGQLTIDFEDIAQIRSQRVLAVNFDDGTILRGQVYLTDNEIRFDSPDNTPRPMNQIVSFARGAERELDRWSLDIAAGSNFKRGNTNEDIVDININASRQTSVSRFTLDYLSTFRDIEGQEVENSHRLNLNADRFINSSFFWRPLLLEYYRDELQNIESRYTVGTGIGWHVIDTDRTNWDLTAGPGYQSTTFVSVPAEDDRHEGSYLFTMESDFEYEITSDIDFNMLYNLQYTDDSLGRIKHHMVTGLEIDLVGELELDVSLIWDRIEEPQPNEDGSIPAKDDSRLSVGVSYEF